MEMKLGLKHMEGREGGEFLLSFLRRKTGGCTAGARSIEHGDAPRGSCGGQDPPRERLLYVQAAHLTLVFCLVSVVNETSNCSVVYKLNKQV